MTVQSQSLPAIYNTARHHNQAASLEGKHIKTERISSSPTSTASHRMTVQRQKQEQRMSVDEPSQYTGKVSPTAQHDSVPSSPLWSCEGPTSVQPFQHQEPHTHTTWNHWERFARKSWDHQKIIMTCFFFLLGIGLHSPLTESCFT